MVVERNLLLENFRSPRSLRNYLYRQLQQIKDIGDIASVINFEPILFKLIHEEKLKTTYAVASLVKYVQFLILCKENRGGSNVPTEQIDTVWHLHIMDTQKYEKDCMAYLGFFLHHFPYFGMRSKKDAKNLHKAFRKMQVLFLKRFGESIDGVGAACSAGDCRNCVNTCNDAGDGLVNNIKSNLKPAVCDARCGSGDDGAARCNCGDKQRKSTNIRPTINLLFRQTA